MVSNLDSPILLDENFTLDSQTMRVFTSWMSKSDIPLKDTARLWFSMLTLMPYIVAKRLKFNISANEISNRLQLIVKQSEESVTKSKALKRDLESLVTNGIPMYGSLLWQISGESQGLSTDLLTPETSFCFRFVSDAIFDANKQLNTDSNLLLPSDFKLLGIDVPLLVDIPPERVLEIFQKEESAYHNFRSSLNEKLLSITSPIGSKERIIEIQKVRETIVKDCSSLSLAYQQLQNDYSRRFAVNLSISSFSILIAGLSALGQNLGPISVASGVVAGTGLITSIKEFSKDWLEHKRDLDKLRVNDNYFIWKLMK